MSHSDDIIYDYPPMYDEYKDKDWYLWFGSGRYDEEIDQEDLVPIRKIPKNPFVFVHPCAAAGKQAPQVRSPLDRSEFWICCSRLIDARSNRWDFRLMFSAKSYDFLKLLFVQVCAVAEKQAARIRSPLDRSDFWICDPRLIDASSDRWDFRSEHSTGSYSSLKLLQFVFDYEKHMSLNYNGGTNRADEKEKARNEFENFLIYSNMCVEILEDGHSIVHKKRSNYSFDPGGCNSDSSCQAKGNSRTSFFQEEENDAGTF